MSITVVCLFQYDIIGLTISDIFNEFDKGFKKSGEPIHSGNWKAFDHLFIPIESETGYKNELKKQGELFLNTPYYYSITVYNNFCAVTSLINYRKFKNDKDTFNSIIKTTKTVANTLGAKEMIYTGDYYCDQLNNLSRNKLYYIEIINYFKNKLGEPATSFDSFKRDDKEWLHLI
ncbi:MAG: hypothetical protein GY714_07410 [Desulfobacterales bacterium]|nr:hypothetical protein [Desulfobacterales bacterium]MCP4158952.1 hypothetical protein [Deltaproteobacteria bacterium]